MSYPGQQPNNWSPGDRVVLTYRLDGAPEGWTGVGTIVGESTPDYWKALRLLVQFEGESKPRVAHSYNLELVRDMKWVAWSNRDGTGDKQVYPHPLFQDHAERAVEELNRDHPDLIHWIQDTL